LFVLSIFLCGAGIDCGYVYRDGNFKKLPSSYRCPTCNVGKNRFKAQGGSSVLAQKKANKEAFRAKRAAAAKKGGLTGREALKQKMMDAQRDADQKRGRWF
jgi:rubredoxin